MTLSLVERYAAVRAGVERLGRVVNGDGSRSVRRMAFAPTSLALKLAAPTRSTRTWRFRTSVSERAEQMHDGLLFIAAPELRKGREVTLDTALSRKICERIGCVPAPRGQFVARADLRPLVENFIDPVSRRQCSVPFAG